MSETIAINICGNSDGQPIAIDKRMLMEGGDFFNDEALTCRRLRAQRSVLLDGIDDAPIVCRGDDAFLFVTTETGKQMASETRGEAYGESTPVDAAIVPADRLQAAGSLSNGVLLAAWGANGTLRIKRMDGFCASWKHVCRMELEGCDRLEAAAGTRIVQLRNGSLLFPVLCDRKKRGNTGELVVCISDDEGTTWRKFAAFGRGCDSANLLELKTGDLLAAIVCRQEQYQKSEELGIEREHLLNNVVLARSADGGQTWTDHQCVTRYGEAPGDLLELSDGTIVLTYGQQNFPWGARAVVSKDGGCGWGDQFYILGLSTVSLKLRAGGMQITEPGWHVSSTVVDDDVILTVYNRGSLVVPDANGVLAERGKAVLAVRWKLGGMDLPPVTVPGVLAEPNDDGYLDNGRCLIKPEHLAAGGDYLHEDEILACRRFPAEHVTIGPSGSAPIVTRGPNEELFACAFFGEIYRSDDEGRTWTLTTTHKFEEPNQSFGVLADGTMIIQFMNGGLVRSEDGGKTWSEPFTIDVPPFDHIGSGNCMRINQLPGGPALLTAGNLMLDAVPAVGLDWDGVLRSHDSGKTWGDFSYIGARCCETNLLRLKSGRMLAAIRTQGPRMTDEFIHDPDAHVVFIKSTSLAVSDDDGYTWSSPWTVTRFFECPGDLVEMDDGSIVLSYMEKVGASGSRAMVSHDEGKSWDEWFYILGWWPRTGGHTSSVGLKDGNVMTVSTDGSSGHATIWKPLSFQE